MKKINLIAPLVLCICCCTAVKAQYIVTKVSGKVTTASGNSVRPGTELKTDESLSWSSLKDKLWVVMIGKGEKIITPSPRATPNKSLLTEVLIASLHQDSRSGSLSGRGEIVEKIPDALHVDVNSNGKIIIEQENKFLFDPKIYPQTNGSTFFIEIDVPGQKPIIRTLKTSQDTLFINYPDFVTESSNSSIKYSVGYHTRTPTNTSKLVASFTPYFDMTNEMDEIIANTIKAYSNITNKDVVRDSVYRNVYASSGKPNGLLFVDLYNKYWLTKGINTADGRNGGKGGVFDEQAFISVPKLSTSLDVTRAELPDNFSLRQYAPPIGYQGQFGSCTAWSTSYASRTMLYAIRNNYSITNQYDKIKSFSFSPDFIYNNIRRSADCDAGTSIPVALEFMKTKGDLIKIGDFVCGKAYNTTELSSAQGFKIKDYLRVNDPNISKAELIQKMKSLLASKHPLPFGMHCPESFDKVGPTGIWYPTEADRQSGIRVKNRQEPFQGHAMCVIGYSDAINNGSFEIMNSWGTWSGNKGFYWISYDDFYLFTSDVYSMVDFEPPIPEVPPVKIEIPAVVKPVVVIPKQVIVQPNVVQPNVVQPNIVQANVVQPVIVQPVVVIEKPKLKGGLEFMLMRPDNSFETVPVNKKQVGMRGQMVEGDTPDPLSYANFVLAKDFHSGNQYKIKFDLAQPAYVYVIGMDKQSTYVLFPQKKLNESALININNATLFLPNDNSHYTLDNVTGKEKMCILVAKSPIDIDVLNQQYSSNDNNLYQAVRKNLDKRLLEMKSINFTANKIGFNTEVNDTDVLAFFIEMNHL